MNRMIYAPEGMHRASEDWRVWAYVQPNAKLVVQWDVFRGHDWQFVDDHVCEDISHFIAVWENRWDS